MLTGQRFVLGGLNRLTIRVAAILAGRGAEVVVMAGTGTHPLSSRVETTARLVMSDDDPESHLREAGVQGAVCLLALSEDDLENLALAVACAAVAPDIPVVLRAFNPALVDQLQGLNVRRAYSVSALAGPAFVAAALGAEVVETLRLGEAEVPVCRLTVRPRSPLAGRTAAELTATFGCGVLAHATTDGTWHPTSGATERFEEGVQMLVGGPLEHVLLMAMANSRLFEDTAGATDERRWGLRRRGAATPAAKSAAGERSLPRRIRGATLLPVTAVVLGFLLVVTVVVFAVALDLGPVDAIYAAVNTAFGSPNLAEEAPWLKVFGVVAMIAGGVLIGILFSWLASIATVDRLERQAGRQVHRLSGHAVVAGLGTIGYRVEQILHRLGVPAAVLDRSPDTRFAGAVTDRTPVLTGDVRLPENLARTGIAEADCVFAVTDDDLTNIETCLQARRLNPDIRTVARLFDETLAERAGGAFGIDVGVSASRVAATAFVGAATDERAFRPFRVGDQGYAAVRRDIRRAVSPEGIEDWRARGARVLAFVRDEAAARPPSELVDGLRPSDTIILAGPEGVVREIADAL